MLSFALLKDVQDYILARYSESGDTIAREDAIKYWNEHTEDRHGLKVSDLPKINPDESEAKTIVLNEEEIFSGTGYNPENDFPIPSFLRSNEVNLDTEPQPVKDGHIKKEKASKSVSKSRKSPFFKDIIGLEADEDVCSEEALMPSMSLPALGSNTMVDELRKSLDKVDEGFGQILLHFIDASGITDAECYKRAQITRSHFNKIKNDPTYHVQKETVVAFALALQLDIKDSNNLLAKAGYTFSDNSKFDLIIQYCIEHALYDVIEVNQLLYAFDQKLLGAGIRE